MSDRLDLRATIDSGHAELVADPGFPNGWTLIVNDVAQSYVDLAAPTRLPMMYARLLAAAGDVVATPRTPVKALHLGGGGLTIPRYLAATRPGSRQTVVEIDRGLVEFVSYGLPLSTADITIVVGDAAEEIDVQPAQHFDLIYSDIYRGGDMPAAVAGIEFVTRAHACLAEHGLFVVNVLDATGLLGTRRHTATLQRVFDHVVIVATPAMLRGRRDGNVIVIASPKPISVDALLSAAQRRQAPARVISGDALASFVGATAPISP